MNTNQLKIPWYLNSWLIAILAAFWFFLFPGIIAIILLQKQQKFLTRTILSDMNQLNEHFEKINSENKELKKLCTSESLQFHDIKKEIEQKSKELELLNKDIIVAEETIELESFSLYTPRWNFSKADEYKIKLKSIIDEQKSMLRNGIAAYGNMNWTVNNNKVKGQKLVKDMIKLCLRSFNNECDAAISSIKFNNYDRCEARIYKSAEAVEKLGSIMGVYINEDYISLKIQELQLALEFETKKQEEKDRLRELRAQEREEAQARKEMELARKAAEKEQTHYENALDKLNAQLLGCSNEEERIELLKKKSEIENHLSTIEENIKDLDYRAANIKAGYVYIISNIGAFGEDIYKIGMTRRLDPQDRIDELGDASVPFKFDVHAMIFSDNAPALEAALHKEFESKKVNMVNNRKEFFNVTLDEIKQVVHANHDKVVEFTDIPDAPQYRESIKIRKK